MMGNVLQRYLRLDADEGNMHQLEGFIETICDDFHIYDAYYGNILASSALIFEIYLNLKSGEPSSLSVYFSSKPKGLYFTVKLEQCFLDMALLHEKAGVTKIDDADDVSVDLHKMQMIRLLTDEVNIMPEEQAIEMVYFITGVNEMLTQQRIELLEKYYHKMTVTKKV